MQTWGCQNRSSCGAILSEIRRKTKAIYINSLGDLAPTAPIIDPRTRRTFAHIWKANVLSQPVTLQKSFTSPGDASRRTPSAPDPPSTVYTVASSTAARAPASLESPADRPPPPACAFQTHALAYGDAHPPPAPGSAQSPSQSGLHCASSTCNPPASADSSPAAHSPPGPPCPQPRASPRAPADKPSTPPLPHPPAEPAVPSVPCPAPTPHHPATSRSPSPAQPAPRSESRIHTTHQRSRRPSPATPLHPASPLQPSPRPTHHPPANSRPGSPPPYSAPAADASAASAYSPAAPDSASPSPPSPAT